MDLRHELFLAFRRANRLLARLERPLARVPGVSALYHALYRRVKPHGLVQVEVDGARLWVDAADEGVSRPLLVKGVFEPEETALVKDLLAPGMCFVDVGANLGYFTVLAARRVGPSGSVHAFEPAPGNLALLRRNVAENGLGGVVRVHALALSDRAGSAELHLDQHNLGNPSLARANVPHLGRAPVAVATARLDDLLAQDVRVDVLKLDVQGSEARVLGGAARVLANPALHIILELWPLGLRRADSDARALLEDLGARGFRAHLGGRAHTTAEILAACGPDGFVNLHLARDL